MPGAIKRVFWRLLMFYVLGVSLPLQKPTISYNQLIPELFRP
jgi:amino acid permease